MPEKQQQQQPKPAQPGPEEEAAAAASGRGCCGCRFPLLLALLQLGLGVAVAVLGLLMALSSASLLGRDTPYWAGSLVCIVALVGLVMLCISYEPDEKTCGQFAIKVVYFLLSALSVVVCVLAVAFAAYCYAQITQFACEAVSETCQCKLDTEDPLGRTFVYQDVTDCPGFLATLSLYLLIQIALNLLAALVGLVACFVMWKDRYQIFYVGLWRRSPKATVAQQPKV